MKSTTILPILSLQIGITLSTFYMGYCAFLLEEKITSAQESLKTTIVVMAKIAEKRKEADDFSKPLPKGINAPSFSLKDEKGNLIDLKNYLGKKVLLVFSSIGDCDNCKKINTAINQLHNTRKDLEILFLLHESNSEQNNKYKNHFAIKDKVLSSSINEIENYHIDALPTSVLINEEGSIVETFRAKKLSEFIEVIYRKSK
ncbi:TlpA family protein disulfide reductase [Flavobacterium sp.]|uniref:TlpA family protein disulfide reductase n=1 Tax=Flavobacterium sp. TaxID=239 RepID=UPI003750F118